MSSNSLHIRQALFGSQGSIELSVSHDAFLEVGKTLRSHAGQSASALFVFEKNLAEGFVEEVRRSLTSAGFFVHDVPFESLLVAGEGAPSLSSNSYQAVLNLLTQATELEIGSSDVLVGIGDEDVLNLVGASASLIAGKPSVAYIPTTYSATLLAGSVKAHFSLEGIKNKIEVAPHLSFLVTDSEILRTHGQQNVSETLVRADQEKAFALMIKAAFIDSKNTWDAFLERIDALAGFFSGAQHEMLHEAQQETAEQEATEQEATEQEATEQEATEQDFLESIAEAARSLSFIQNAAALTMRTSLSYGNLFTQTFQEFSPELSTAQAMGEALRLSALLGVAPNGMPPRYLIEQEAALETLGILKSAQAREIEAAEFLKKAKEIARHYSREVLVPLPFAPGRLSMMALQEETFNKEFEVFRKESI